MVNQQNIHKIIKIYVQTKIKGTTINYALRTVDIIKNAEASKELYIYNDSTYFCCHKTTYNEQPAIVMAFAIQLPGSLAGSSSASECVMSIVSMIESHFSPIEETDYAKEISNDKKLIGFLKIIKILREDDFL